MRVLLRWQWQRIGCAGFGSPLHRSWGSCRTNLPPANACARRQRNATLGSRGVVLSWAERRSSFHSRLRSSSEEDSCRKKDTAPFPTFRGKRQRRKEQLQRQEQRKP